MYEWMNFEIVLSLPSSTLLLKLGLPETIQSLYRSILSLENDIDVLAPQRKILIIHQ